MQSELNWMWVGFGALSIAIAPDPDDYLKQADALLHWAIDCERNCGA